MMKYPYQLVCRGDSRREMVRQIQNRLNKMNCGPMDEDGIFGKQTLQALLLFQSLFCDLYGLPLVRDGKVGPATWSSLFGRSLKQAVEDSPLAHEAIRIARGEIGVMEDPPGSNNGVRVREYLHSVGLDYPQPWCAAFVYWCMEQAAARQNRLNPLVKTGGCLNHFRLSRGEKLPAQKAIENPLLIQPGSIFILDRGAGKGHTGLVTGVFDDFLTTIEGNTNMANSAEGQGVCQLNRKIYTVNVGYLFYN